MAGLCGSGGAGRLARADRVCGSLALAVELLADEVGDDLDGESRSMVEVGLVDGSKSVAIRSVGLLAKRDGRTAARAKVERSTGGKGATSVEARAAELGSGGGSSVALGFCLDG